MHEIGDREYQAAISEGLSAAYVAAFRDPRPFRINTDRMIIFSDLHKGARNGADEFRRCERAYNSALGYYYTLGYWLVELGDVEELWEERARTVIRTYERTLRLSAKFHIDPDARGSRYTRVWGNHDDQWSHRDQIDKFLVPIYCPEGSAGLDVHGSVVIQVFNETGQPLGELFLAHGHQGTFESDRASWFSRIVVRYLWRPFQRLTNYSLNTPAKDWVLRAKHNLAMHEWVIGLERSDLIFVAGHTHKPVFLAKSKAELLTAEIRRVEEALQAAPNDPQLLHQLALLAADLEWTRAEGKEETGPDGIVSAPQARYFNAGCASYLDGDVTGIELVGDEIRLVRWPTDDGAPQPKTLAAMRLSDLFAQAPATL
jgi:hypothetical protein